MTDIKSAAGHHAIRGGQQLTVTFSFINTIIVNIITISVIKVIPILSSKSNDSNLVILPSLPSFGPNYC